jgi:hypothetical protein
VQPGKDLFGAAHVQPPFLQRAPSLRRVAGYAHALSVATFIRSVKGPGEDQ